MRRLTPDEHETNLKFEHAKPFPFAPTLETGSRVRGDMQVSFVSSLN